MSKRFENREMDNTPLQICVLLEIGAYDDKEEIIKICYNIILRNLDSVNAIIFLKVDYSHEDTLKQQRNTKND